MKRGIDKWLERKREREKEKIMCREKERKNARDSYVFRKCREQEKWKRDKDRKKMDVRERKNKEENNLIIIISRVFTYVT